MNDIYSKTLSQKETLLMIMNRILPIKELSFKIINIKDRIEKNEIYDYHNEIHSKIAKEHYYLHKNHIGKFSFIHDSKYFIIKKDFKLDFYNYTGISYQIIELIHELIKMKNEKYMTQDEGYEYWLNYDDKLYTLLSEKISQEMK